MAKAHVYTPDPPNVLHDTIRLATAKKAPKNLRKFWGALDSISLMEILRQSVQHLPMDAYGLARLQMELGTQAYNKLDAFMFEDHEHYEHHVHFLQ